MYVSGQIGLNPSPVIAGNKKVTVNSHVDFCVANAHSFTGLPQKKGVNPNYCYKYTEIKYVKDVSCVSHLSSANLVTNAPPVVISPPVGARLHILGEVGSSRFKSKSSHHTQRGLHPPLLVQTEPNQVTNCHKQLPKPIQTGPPFGGTVSAGEQKCSGTGSKTKLTRVLQPSFLVPKPNNQWRPVLDLSTWNTFLNTESFKMETPETIRTSLHSGEWVTSIDFKDAYFYIPIHSQSRKYMRFHIQDQSYQFKALPFGLSTAPMEFTVVAKKVKLMALQRGIRIHQYLDDWLVRATSHQTCLQHTQTLVALSRELGWLVNKEKSELEPKQVFNLIGYQFDLREGKVRPTPDHWQTLQHIVNPVRCAWSGSSCPS